VLVHALNGGRVDRLPEEKRRGITIELGFSHFQHDGSQFALIDVPGHEGFIHTMVAGASGVDAALLVVAADDSVMPQTREHLALLQFLGIRHGAVAITKCDLADEEQLEMVELEVAELVTPTFLAAAPPIRVSVHDGEGIEEVRRAIVAAARSSPPRRIGDAEFRMPIDRAFTMTGQGTVVTGTVWRGSAKVGDALQLLPAGTPVRVRRMQSQGADVEHASAGERAAINLVGVKGDEIHRGNELITVNAFESSLRHLVQLSILPDAERGIKHRQAVRLHLGANQATVQVLMNQRVIAPGERSFAILRCEMPVVAEYGQPFVVRQLSPARTIGGGIVIGPALRAADRQNRVLSAADGLASTDAKVRLAAYIELRREVALDETGESYVGLSRSDIETIVNRLVERREVIRVDGPRPLHVSAQRFQQLKELATRRIKIELERRKPASFVLLSVILSALKRHASRPVWDAVIADMIAKRELTGRDRRVGLPTGAELSNRQRGMLTTLLEEVAAAGPTPPTLKEFAEKHKFTLEDVAAIVEVAVDESAVVRLTSQLVMSRAALETLRQRLAAHFAKSSTAKVGEIREQWGITRKHAVPIFEFFDHHQITTRAGDLRSAGPRLATPINQMI
jgi:selenocysteine-specific elongation factor